MKINTNRWNKIRYTLYTPGYDLIAGYFKDSRKKSIDSLDLKPGEKVLIIGVGTGLDLEFIPSHCEIMATDLTPSMIERVKKMNLSRPFRHLLLKLHNSRYRHVLLPL